MNRALEEELRRELARELGEGTKNPLLLALHIAGGAIALGMSGPLTPLEPGLAPQLCPTCGEPTQGGFDGGKNRPYESCTRTRYRPPAEPMRCNFYAAPPRWLAAVLKELGAR